MIYWLLSISIIGLIANFNMNYAVVKGKLPMNNIIKISSIVISVVVLGCSIAVFFLD